MNVRVALHHSTAVLAAFSLALAGCGGGGGGGNGNGGGSPTPSPSPTGTPTPSSRLFSDPAQEALSVANVQQVIAQAVGEAQARGLPSVIAVVDRVGNVLGVFRMNGARATTRTSAFISFTGAVNNPPVEAQGLDVPATAAAIAKAVTGAYLSSGGNAFSTRTASQIVQQHFPPAPAVTMGFESGPLFGVQFSSLPCSDLTARFQPAGGAGALIGPKRTPLGLAADAGGFPLYKNGVVVGGVGVVGDGDYGFDPDTRDFDTEAEEFIALAAIQNFAPSETIRADRISVDGTLLRFSDARTSGLATLQTNFAAIDGAAGALVPVNGYSAGAIIPGAPYGTEASGIRQSTAAEFANRDIFVLTDGTGANRYPIRAGTDAANTSAPLTAAEVRAVLEEGFTVMSRGRAQIRQPLNSRIQVSLSVVDTNGAVLGLIRSPDAPIFGIDVSLQKARTAMFFSSRFAAPDLLATGGSIAGFVQRMRSFLGDPLALTGNVAYSNRGQGLLERPYFPDGEVNRPPGPLAQPIEDFNPFATGLQTQLIAGNLLQHAGFILGANADTPARCTGLPETAPGLNRLANGLQIFPGSVPIYRGDTLVGALGVSGDGIDQDDMISFLGTHNGGTRVGGSIGNAPKPIRSDRVEVELGGRVVRLRYVNCPFRPFLDTDADNVCEGL